MVMVVSFLFLIFEFGFLDLWRGQVGDYGDCPIVQVTRVLRLAERLRTAMRFARLFAGKSNHALRRHSVRNGGSTS